MRKITMLVATIGVMLMIRVLATPTGQTPSKSILT